jgi:hypothetical protein
MALKHLLETNYLLHSGGFITESNFGWRWTVADYTIK